MQPSLNMSSDATTAGRQLGGYAKELAGLELDYKLGMEQQATDLRREQLNSLFGLLMSEQTSKGNVASSTVSSGFALPGSSTTVAYDPNNPKHDPYKPWTWIK